MKYKHLIVYLPLAGALLLSAGQRLTSFQKKAVGDTIYFKVPLNFPQPESSTVKNRLTSKGFILGKALFFDARLSADGRISCSSCHQQSAAFANLNSAFSNGINGQKGSRNTPALFNLAWQKEFMWDGRLNRLSLVPVNALTSPLEMGNSMDRVLETVRQDKSYQTQFKRVFGTNSITQDRLLDALSQFTAMLISANSKYDQVIRKEGNSMFSANEQAGYLLFQQKCNTCHTQPLFTDNSYRNNGLDLKYSDNGRDSLTHQIADLAKFKVPSLRNIEITGPYMHDGRFRTLKQVLQHYDSGMKAHANLDAAFNKEIVPGIRLNLHEQEDLISFLKTLTDVSFINDTHFNLN